MVVCCNLLIWQRHTNYGIGMAAAIPCIPIPAPLEEQSCAMVPRRRFFGDFLRPVFPAIRVQHVSELHPINSHSGHTMCGSMVKIQSAMAENRRGKKIDRSSG